MWAACAQFQHRAPEILPFSDRIQTQSDGDVRVTVGVPSADESRQIFGLPLAAKDIQPVWLEIQNNDTTDYYLLAINLDPDLFSAGEVAWKFKTGYSDDAKQKINALFREKEMKSYFEPGTTTTGFLYTNIKFGTKLVLVKLLGEGYFGIGLPKEMCNNFNGVPKTRGRLVTISGRFKFIILSDGIHNKIYR